MYANKCIVCGEIWDCKRVYADWICPDCDHGDLVDPDVWDDDDDCDDGPNGGCVNGAGQ